MNTVNIRFFLNNELKDINIPAGITALEYIREYSGLTGTKLGCGEGDCGACTIAVGTYRNGTVKYEAVNSCLMPATKMHLKHIVTIEGLAPGEQLLHPIQLSIVENHATQCGFCTPGINMSLFCYFINNQKTPVLEDAVKSLEGNLCRCTGYKSINESVLQDVRQIETGNFVVPPYFEKIKKAFPELIAGSKPPNNKSYYLPQTKKDLFKLLEKNKNAKIINGGTDLMVNKELKNIAYPCLIDIAGIDELRNIEKHNNEIIIGATVTLSDIINSDLIKKYLPVLRETLQQMASVQIRNVATLTGNVCNASPVADSAVVLMVAGAKLNIVSGENKQRTGSNN